MRFGSLLFRALACATALCTGPGLPEVLAQVLGDSNVTVRVMAANLTSGNFQRYETPGLNILQGLKPDVVALQEFNVSNSLGVNTAAAISNMVATTFGPEFHYYREPDYSLPNGIISRWPLLASGSWNDPQVSNRGFAWAQIDLPGTNDLYLVSVHLHSSGGASSRAIEATNLVNLILANFPAGAWIILGGDFNTDTRSEAAMLKFTTVFSDRPIPTDGLVGGNPNTNAGRNKPYDYVLFSFSLTNRLVPVALASQSFSDGLVFDSQVYEPLSDVPPVAATDSAAAGMQHMAVIKDFQLSSFVTNPVASAPLITGQPASQSVTAGATATFTVTASGELPLRYQWRWNESPLLAATNSSYVLTHVQPAAAGGYSVIVTNAFGSATSEVATLIVNPGVSTGAVIAQWTFNSVAPDNNPATGTLLPAVGQGIATLVGGTTATFAGGASSDPAAAAGDNSGWNSSTYPPVSSGNKTAGVRFDVSTVGQEDLIVTWQSQSSSTGSRYGRLQYSTNGSLFLDFPAPFTNATSFSSKTNLLTGLAGVDNNPNFAIRFVSEFESSAIGAGTPGYVAANPGSSYGSGGTMRYDVVTLRGRSLTLPPPAAAAVLGPATISNGLFHCWITGTTGVNYLIQAATNLPALAWHPAGLVTAPAWFTDTNPPAPTQKFYRAVTQ